MDFFWLLLIVVLWLTLSWESHQTNKFVNKFALDVLEWERRQQEINLEMMCRLMPEREAELRVKLEPLLKEASNGR